MNTNETNTNKQYTNEIIARAMNTNEMNTTKQYTNETNAKTIYTNETNINTNICMYRCIIQARRISYHACILLSRSKQCQSFGGQKLSYKSAKLENFMRMRVLRNCKLTYCSSQESKILRNDDFAKTTLTSRRLEIQ